MENLKNYDVDFSGLKNGKHQFKFEVSQAFFSLFDAETEFSNANLITEVLVDKHSTFLDFRMNTSGTVTLHCDISNEPYEYPLVSEMKFLVKFGEEFDDSNEEIIVIPHHSHSFNIAQLIYEQVLLSIPMKKVSPNLTEEDFTLLENYSLKEIEENIDTTSDPRWDALKKLK